MRVWRNVWLLEEELEFLIEIIEEMKRQCMIECEVVGIPHDVEKYDKLIKRLQKSKKVWR